VFTYVLFVVCVPERFRNCSQGTAPVATCQVFFLSKCKKVANVLYIESV